MKLRILLFFLFGFQLVSLFSDVGMDTKSSFYISEEQLKIYKVEALKGSRHKASMIFEYFSLCDYQPEKAAYWSKIGAENGSEIAEYNYGCILDDIDEEYLRAYFFLKKAADKNVDSAKLVLPYLLKKLIRKDIDVTNEFVLPEVINETNINIFCKAAKLGNIKAADTLVNFYQSEYVITEHQGNIDLNVDKSPYIYWLQIGCENGSINCIRIYSNLLKNSSDEYDIIRAEFWNKKAAL